MLDILLNVIIERGGILTGIEELEQQHLETYKNALLELIQNNTETLITEDIASLLKQPPLDSMDLVKSKLVNLSKCFGVILNTEVLNQVLNDYRSMLLSSFARIGEERISRFSKMVKEFQPAKQTDIIKFPKKEFATVNKKIKKEAKEKLTVSNQVLLEEIPNLFKEDTDSQDKGKVVDAMRKYLTGSYTKELLENMELKMVIKDTTLMNSTLEQGERYLFTRSNSHLFDTTIKKA